jgi:hypothetical protein
MVKKYTIEAARLVFALWYCGVGTLSSGFSGFGTRNRPLLAIYIGRSLWL